MVTKLKEEGKRDKLYVYGIKGYKLQYIKKIKHDILYSTGNHIQYVVITCNGLWSEKEKSESLCCTPETNTILLSQF